jgi:hypothetical protein
MDKQEAVHYVHQMLDQDHSQDEIVRVLVDQLRAPQDLVKKFVAQTASAYHNEKARQAEDSKPTWLRDLQSSANEPAQPTLLATPPPPAPTNTPAIQLPPWLQENGPLERQFVREVDVWRHAKTASTPPAPQSNDIPLQAANLTAGWDQPKQRRDPLQDTQLMEFILERLGKSRKRSDVVMAVCERANLSWDEAERVVGQAAIQKDSQGAVRVSEGMMFVGILMAVCGFVLAAIYGLPMMAQVGAPYGLRLPFDGQFAIRQPALAVAIFVGGMSLVGFGASVAYLYYHAAEEQEA